MPSDSRDMRLGGSALQSAAVAALFIGSGCAALVYEIVWFHLLRLVIGSSAISLGILLASFMGGMCLGSLMLPIIVPARFHPLRVYAALELAIAAIGCSLPWWLTWVSSWYLRHAAESLTGMTARAVVAAIALIPPTMLMGATLPAVARWVKNTPTGLSKLGVFYGANIAGAVLGCLLAAFVLLPRTDVVYASNVAAAINVAVAVLAIAISRRAPYQPAIEQGVTVETTSRNAPAALCVVATLSGFAALGAEVVWTRLLSLLFGSTVYTFAIILAVFLTGLGIGSTLAAAWLRWARNPVRWLVVAQLAIVAAVPFANHMITRVVPLLPRPEVHITSDVYAVFLHDTLRAAAALLPAAIFWGASFPLTLAAAGRGQGDAARFVGQIYAANTLGAILGSLLTSAAFIPLLGSQRTQQVFVLVSGLAAALAIGVRPHAAEHESIGPNAGQFKAAIDSIFRFFARPIGRIALFSIALAAVGFVQPPPRGMFARSLDPNWWQHYEVDDVFIREGRSATVVVQKFKLVDWRYLCIGGKIEASNILKDLRCERLLGHLPALIHPTAKKTLTVGLGTGTTAGCFVLHPEVEEIAICEIEPVVREAARKYFAKENHDVVNNPRTKIHFDDARHFLATTGEKFDVITSDPINSWIRGASTLYSSEYYELCKQHLNPGGIMVQWIPLYEKDIATAKCELATFLRAFPHATLWTTWTNRDDDLQKHDIIAIGSNEPTKLDLVEFERRINLNPALKTALEEVNIGTIPDLIGQFAGLGEDLAPWIADAEINGDSSLRLEYLAGLSLWMAQADPIFQEIARYRRYPAGVFQNDAEFKDEILGRWGLGKTSD